MVLNLSQKYSTEIITQIYKIRNLENLYFLNKLPNNKLIKNFYSLSEFFQYREINQNFYDNHRSERDNSLVLQEFVLFHSIYLIVIPILDYLNCSDYFITSFSQDFFLSFLFLFWWKLGNCF